jgi:broad specificity phosphatase PhoE
MTDIVLTRHAESIWHAENRYAGVSDIPITPRGRRQADRLADWAVTATVDAVWSSDLVRARATAEPVCAALGLPLHVDPRLREVDFGRAEGRTSGQLAAAEPQSWQAFELDPVTNHHPEGEHPDDAVRRFTDCLQEIATARPAGRILVVAHSTAIRLALCSYLGIPLRGYRAVFPALGSCALTEIRLSAGQPALLSYNVTAREDGTVADVTENLTEKGTA